MKYFDIANKYRGLKEISGKKHNPKIVKMYADVGFSGVKDDETAWCAAFVGSVLKEAGYPYKKSLAARSYLDYGQKVTEPQEGDIVIFWRGKKDSWQGHVGFVVTYDSKYVWCLGGNQKNSVNVQRFARDRVLGFRRPVPFTITEPTPKEVEKVVKKNSVKLSVGQQIRNFFVFLGASIAGLFSMDTLNILTDASTKLKGFLTDNMLVIGAAAVGIGWFVSKWYEWRTLDDYKEGRYTPSGMENKDA